MVKTMTAITQNIATWDQIYCSESQFEKQYSIATESMPAENPEWEKCTSSLEEIWRDPSLLEDPRPNLQTIQKVICWLYYLRKIFPYNPPSCIIPEPTGGIIVDFRTKPAGGKEIIYEFTFCNDRKPEYTEYLDGRIQMMSEMGEYPPK